MMRDKDELTRRSLLRASAATAAGIGGVGTASATETTDGDLDRRESAERVPCLEVEDETETATVASGVPEQASGIRPGSQMFIAFPDGTTPAVRPTSSGGTAAATSTSAQPATASCRATRTPMRTPSGPARATTTFTT